MNIRPALSSLLALICLAGSAFGQSEPWNSFAQDAQHSAQSPAVAQPLSQTRWQTPVDLAPQYSGDELLIHYGSPLVTAANTVIVPLKTGAQGGFQVEARSGFDGSLIWSLATDYVLPAHSWTPVFGPVLTPPAPTLYFPGAGGTVYSRQSPDSASGAEAQIAFFGNAVYSAAPTTYNQNVMIDTPLTSDSAGNIYFGFLVTGATPANLQSGIARISATGQGTWIAAAVAANDNSITHVVYNCAPALSTDGSTVYVSVSNGTAGYLLALNSTTLAPVASMRLKDPKSRSDAWLSDNGSASPTVGPDGDVYFGVLENPFPENHDRGWLLHFDSTLSQSKTPGAFGWDDTAAVLPSSAVPSYTGASSYLLMSKYNNYANVGGDGQNKIAVLDPDATETDPITGVTVMNEVLTILGPTANPSLAGVKEWCINSAATDPATKSIFANSEDGDLYRWDLTTNTLSQALTLTPGLGEAYTPTVIGVDGTVYAINNATLFAVGGAPDLTISVSHSGTFTAGSNGTFSIKATNQGTASTSGIIAVTDTLPSDLGFVHAGSGGNGWGCSAIDQAVTCLSTTALVAGSNSSFPMVVSVTPDAFPSVTNSASVADANDPVSADKTSAPDAANVDNAPPSVTASVSPGVVYVGQSLSLTIGGTGFNSSTQVQINGGSVITGAVANGGTALVVSVPASQLTATGAATIKVTNPAGPATGNGGGSVTISAGQSLTVADFTLAQTNSGTVQLAAGTPVNVILNLSTTPASTPLPAAVTYACAVRALPSTACSMNPASTPAGSTSGTTTLMLTTTAHVPPVPNPRAPAPPYCIWPAAIALVTFLAMRFSSRQAALPPRRRLAYLGLILLIIGAAGSVGCASAVSPTPPEQPTMGTVNVTSASNGIVKTTTINVSLN